MERTSFESWNCSVARALGMVGDGWTLLIVREILYGSTTFNEFQQNLGISKNILSRRLKKMQADGILVRVPVPEDARSNEYRLTDKGEALFPIYIAVMQWGDQWADMEDGAPVFVRTAKTGEPISRFQVTDLDGDPLGLSDIRLTPGPGASADTVARLKR